MKKLPTTFFSIIVFVLTSHLTVFAQDTCTITDYGAKSNSEMVNTKSIQSAIDDCYDNGGGTVLVPTGTFLTGTINLKSNINLHLTAGAVLKGSPDIKDYEPYKAAIHPDTVHYGIIYTHKAENVSITGLGTIDGNEEAFFVWDEAKGIEWGSTEFTRQKENFRSVESGIGDGPVVPKERPRQMVIFSESKNVTVRDVQLNKSPFWTLHIADSDGVTISGINIWTSPLTPNSDGVNITSSRNVSVSDCDIRTGDDAIAITGYSRHYELPGFHGIKHESGNIVITNCNLQSSSSGIRIGYIDQNSMQNIHVSNVNITSSNRGIGIFVRGEGTLSNLTFSQINIHTRLFTGDWWGNGEPIHISAIRGEEDIELGSIRNVTFENINAYGENGILVYGTEESVIEDLRFDNVNFTLLKSDKSEVAGGNIDLRGVLEPQFTLFESNISAFYAQHVKGLTIEDSDFSWEKVNQPYFKHGVHIKNFEEVTLEDVDAEPAPSSSLKPFKFDQGAALQFSGSIDQADIQDVQ